MRQSVDRIRQYLSTPKFHLVVTLGSEMVIRAQTDTQFRDTVRAAALVVPDSIGTILATRYAGFSIKERVAGVELVSVLAQQLGPQLRIFFLGGAPGVAEAAADSLSKLAPAVVVAGCHDGFFKDDDEVCRLIRESGANVVLAAMGFPRQENWLLNNGAKCGAQVGIGVGGTFDI